MLTKSVPVTHVKAGEADGLAEGQFEALVSVVGNKDSYGDVVMSGAFDESLAEWKASGNPIPVIWSHGYYDANNHIGFLIDAAEKTIDGKTGLWVLGQLDTSPDPEDAQARKVAKLLRGRRVTQFSFSYDVLDAGMAKNEDLGDYYELRKLKLYEVGPTLIGANQDTDLLDAKSLTLGNLETFAKNIGDVLGKAGRTLSAANEQTISEAVAKVMDGAEDLKSVLAQVQNSNDGKAKADEPAKDEERCDQANGVTCPKHNVDHRGKAKSEEPMRPTPADLSALQSIELDALLSASE